MPDILFCRVCTFGVVTVEQTFRSKFFEYELEFPGEIFRILNSTVRTSCSKRRNLMRRVSSKYHPSMHEIPDTAALETINTDPFQIRFNLISKHSSYTPHHVFDLHFLCSICFRSDLKIQPPDIIGLHMKQCRICIRESRCKPETAYGRHIRFGFNVCNQELIIKCATLKFKPQ